jgi:bacillithiol system protein YtxJ
MNWITLENEETLNSIVERSAEKKQVIFKHSTRCSISEMSKNRLERSKAPDDTDFYYLDLIAYRNISNEIAERFSVHHESPQILVIKNGECTYVESHSAINMDEIVEA